MTIRIPGPLAICLAILTVLAGLLGAFIVGRATIDQRGLRAHGYANGYAAGLSRGYKHGQAVGYSDGDEAGTQAESTAVAAARQSSYTTGYNAAVKKANGRISQAITAGQNVAFAGYDSWDLGQYYVVQLGSGTGGAKYAMPSRIEMIPGQSYNLCTNGPGICGGALP